MNHGFPFHPIKDNDVKCRISEGCFFALGSSIGFQLEKVSGENDNGVDFRLIKIKHRNGKQCECGSVLDFQLKSTVNWKYKKSNIEYALRSKTYNDIIERNIDGGTPLLLVIMCLPNAEIDRVSVLKDSLVFQRSFFWFHITGTNILPNENSTKLIKIPLNNRLTKDSFVEMVSQHSVSRM